ncbi:hypothetical protein CLOM_g16312, partial [Closterium sp. NIES-68]
GESSRKEGE